MENDSDQDIKIEYVKPNGELVMGTLSSFLDSENIEGNPMFYKYYSYLKVNISFIYLVSIQPFLFNMFPSQFHCMQLLLPVVFFARSSEVLISSKIG
jgi:hypothetical protein